VSACAQKISGFGMLNNGEVKNESAACAQISLMGTEAFIRCKPNTVKTYNHQDYYKNVPNIKLFHQ